MSFVAPDDLAIIAGRIPSQLAIDGNLSGAKMKFRYVAMAGALACSAAASSMPSREFKPLGLLASLAALPKPAVVFPPELVGSWGDDLAACEPEFTRGFKIRQGEISFYDGVQRLISVGAVSAIKTPHGMGRTSISKIRYQWNDNPPATSSERFTVVGKWLYHSGAGISLSKHFSPKNRMIRCPVGST